MKNRFLCLLFVVCTVISARANSTDSLALTPPMGWNSWNCFSCNINEKQIREIADLMVSTGMKDAGYEYLNIDDCWQVGRDNEGNILVDEKNFPSGIKALADYIHSKGLKFGIYSCAGTLTCAGRPGSRGYQFQDARTYAEWGVDYLKYDYCGYLEIEKDSEEKTIREPYIVMRKALDKVNRDIVYCVGYGAPNVWNWAPEAGGNQWRTTRDITDEWNVVTAIGTFQDVCADATAPGRNNDPDMLVVGKLGQGWGSKVHDSYLTADEQYSHISLWCLLSSPLLIGCDMANMDDFTLNLLTNNEVIAVSQDPMVAPAKKMMVENGQVWSKKLYDGSYAVGFFHVDPYFILWDQEDAEAMQMREYAFDFDLKQLGIEGKAMVRDLWRQKDLGEVNGIFRTEVPYHGVTFVKITPAK